MNLLLDTQILVWAFSNPSRLDQTTRRAIEDPLNVVFFSAVSIWEIAIKASLKRSDFEADPLVVLQEAIDIGLIELPVTGSTAARVTSLPFHHRDPFDRLLVVQAIETSARLITADRKLAAYSELVHVVR